MKEDYFSVKALSKSQIKYYTPDNPMKFWNNSVLNPERIEPQLTDPMGFGKLTHAMLLEPLTVKTEFIVCDDYGKSRINKKWIEAQSNEEKTIISSEELQKATAMATAISQYDLYRDLLSGIKSEKEFKWYDEKWSIYCKAKLDAVKNTEEGIYVIDYKTTGMMESITRHIDKGTFQYDIGFYARAIEEKYKQKLVKFFFLFQSNKEGEEHYIKVKCVEKEQLIACEIATDNIVNAIVKRYNNWKAGDKTAWFPTPEIQQWEISPWSEINTQGD